MGLPTGIRSRPSRAQARPPRLIDPATSTDPTFPGARLSRTRGESSCIRKTVHRYTGTPLVWEAAALPGAVTVSGFGFSHLIAAHNAAHDTRHANVFPCP
ncbi:CbtB domain-containing protein [Aromatoleum toluclasticum]|uniref:CbtB domain-containing protein n=1 Tax=Aromatoleum toluclasticum TaxID=92003 RepID=UPI00058B6CCE